MLLLSFFKANVNIIFMLFLGMGLWLDSFKEKGICCDAKRNIEAYFISVEHCARYTIQK